MPKLFPFLDLPPEIREKVYLELILSQSTITLTPVPSDNTPFQTYPHALLLTNAQIYHEIRPLFFSTNTFSISIRAGKNQELDYFLHPSFQDNRRQIRSLKLWTARWGSKDFFSGVLCPVLEDMIMNGKLRELHVTIRSMEMLGRFLSFERQERGDGFNGGLEGEEWKNYKALMGLLRDPYLEKLAVWANCRDELAMRDVTWLLRPRNPNGRLLDT